MSIVWRHAGNAHNSIRFPCTMPHDSSCSTITPGIVSLSLSLSLYVCPSVRFSVCLFDTHCISVEGRSPANKMHVHTLCSRDLDPDPMTLIYKPDLGTVFRSKDVLHRPIPEVNFLSRGFIQFKSVTNSHTKTDAIERIITPLLQMVITVPLRNLLQCRACGRTPRSLPPARGGGAHVC